jgi:hypothetical protein
MLDFSALHLNMRGNVYSNSDCTECARKPDGLWSLKTSLPATRRSLTDSHRAQCCLEFSCHGNVSICVNKIFHFALKSYFILKTVGCFWRTLTPIQIVNIANEHLLLHMQTHFFINLITLEIQKFIFIKYISLYFVIYSPNREVFQIKVVYLCVLYISCYVNFFVRSPIFYKIDEVWFHFAWNSWRSS